MQPARDGSFTLPAHHARVFGEKLQFEPLPHKNTVGYWVNPADYARWRFSGATAESYRVLVYQGCGGGQGGSTVSLSAVPVGDNAVALADGTRLEFSISKPVTSRTSSGATSAGCGFPGTVRTNCFFVAKNSRRTPLAMSGRFA